MADLLPKFIAIRPIIFKDNLHYLSHQLNSAKTNQLYSEGMDVFDPYVKIEVEIAKINRKYVHLRFYHSNKYWARSEHDNTLVVGSKQPVEETCNILCTLFEPTVGSDGLLRLIHIQSRARVRTHLDNTIYLDIKNPEDPEYAFSFVDWNTIVKLPKNVAFKGDNGKYLKAFYHDFPFNQFGISDRNDQTAAYEVTLHPDGHLRIKSAYFGKFLRRIPSDTWILADAFSDADTADTLFWPVKIDGSTIALRLENKFCIRSTGGDDYLSDCLLAEAHSIVKEAKFTVEELILERGIYNIEYRMEDSRVYDEKPFLAGIGTATNESDRDSSISITVSYQDISSTSFTYTLSIMLGGKATIETGVPFILDGEIEISGSVTNTFEWGSTTVKQQTAQATYTALVPKRSRVRVKYVGAQGKCSVPFSYTQRDQSSTDGSVVTSRQIDGVFHGTNYYNFDFVELPIEPL